MNAKNFIALLVIVMLCGGVKAETTLWVHTTDGESVPFQIGEFIDFNLDSVVSVKDLHKLSNIISSFKLLSNHPNPFNPSTNISYELSQPGNVEITIYDVTGKEITTLLSDHQTVGSYKTQWNGENSNGIKVAAGMYFYQLSFNGTAETKKMLLLR